RPPSEPVRRPARTIGVASRRQRRGRPVRPRLPTDAPRRTGPPRRLGDATGPRLTAADLTLVARSRPPRAAGPGAGLWGGVRRAARAPLSASKRACRTPKRNANAFAPSIANEAGARIAESSKIVLIEGLWREPVIQEECSLSSWQLPINPKKKARRNSSDSITE